MPRKVYNALTALAVKNAKPGRHVDGRGLHLLVKKKSGSKSWVFRFTLNGRTRDLGLGTASGRGSLSLAKARDKAVDFRQMVKAGTDPIEESARIAAEETAAAQAARVSGTTFKDAAITHLAARESGWRNSKHRAQWYSTLETYVFPKIGALPVSEISTEHVLDVLGPIWEAKPETASRIRGRIEAVLDGAKVRELRSGDNPARWRGHLKLILPARPKLSRGHHKAMPYDDIPAFFEELRKREALSALALEFTILTVARTGEAIGGKWEEIDLRKAVWTVPPSRMKAGREHRVPLSPRAVEILKAVKPLGSKWVFPSDKGGKLSTMAMSMLLRRMDIDATVHGFRSTLRDWAAECTAYSREVSEMAMAHTIADKSEAAYRRGDLFEKRRRLLNDWADYCANGSAKSATVTPIRGVA